MSNQKKSLFVRAAKLMAIPIIWEKISGIYWMIPAIFSLFIISLLPFAFSIENEYLKNFVDDNFFIGNSPEAARLILSSIATALMTVIGVLFSIIILVIQQASAQYSPRVIESFIKNRVGQLMLGLYVGTFVYCILLLRLLPAGDNIKEYPIPQAALSIAMLLSLICIAFLVHYVHFITKSIKSTSIVNSILDEALDYLYSFEEFINSHECTNNPRHNYKYKKILKTQDFGYLMSYYPDKLDSVLKKYNAEIKIPISAGDYLQNDEVLAIVYTDNPINPKMEKALLKCFNIGDARTHAQDIRYSIKQLVDIALRGLSSGINDPSTALESINGIGTIMLEALKTYRSADYLELEHGTLLKFKPITIEEIVQISMNQIHIHGKEHYPVLKRIREILQYALSSVKEERQKDVLNFHLKQVEHSLNIVQGVELYRNHNLAPYSTSLLN